MVPTLINPCNFKYQCKKILFLKCISAFGKRLLLIIFRNLLNVRVCAYMCVLSMFSFVCVCSQVWAYVYRGQPPSLYTFTFVYIGLDNSWPSGNSHICISHVVQALGLRVPFNMSSIDLNLGPHTCTVSTLFGVPFSSAPSIYKLLEDELIISKAKRLSAQVIL